MIETIKHFTGACGEAHLNLTHILGIAILIYIGYEVYSLGRSLRKN